MFFKQRGALPQFTEIQEHAVSSALGVWRGFLLGQQQRLDGYEQHLYPFDFLEHHSTPNVSPYINRYLMRTIEFDLVMSTVSVFVYTKLSRMVLIGFIQMPDTEEWKGGNLRLNNGVIGRKHYLVPSEFLDYLSDRADHSWEKLSNLSPSQSQKVTQMLVKKGEAFLESEAFQAVAHDERLIRPDASDAAISSNDNI